jgi:putative ABC transport system ATP-binding protein
LEKPIIALTDVDLSLGKGAARVHILRGITLAVTEGESVAMVGPSGSGKSTLLMVMAGLERADAGQVDVAGSDLGNMSEDALAAFRAKSVGIVFQSFHLIPNMTALENVAVPLDLAGRRDAFDAARRELATVGLADRTGHYPTELSGGEQQRVAIARALVALPEIVLADEPTANLDHRTGRNILRLMRRINRATKVTFIFSTHDPQVIRMADRRVDLEDGQIVRLGVRARKEWRYAFERAPDGDEA